MDATKNNRQTSELTSRGTDPIQYDVLTSQLRGVRLLFWTELLCAVFMNLWGMALPLAGRLANLSNQTIFDLYSGAQILPPIAAIFAARGVFRLARTGNRRMTRFFLKFGALLEVMFRFHIAGRALGIVSQYSAGFLVLRPIVFAAVACGVFFFCATMLQSYGDLLRPRRIRLVGLSLAGVTIATTLGTAYLGQEVEVDAKLVNLLELGLQSVMGAWAFYTLWDVLKALRFVRERRCIACGYLLEGSPMSRCSECGHISRRQLESSEHGNA